MAIFQRLQDWQDLKGFTDEQVAADVGCSRSTLSRAKRGLHPLKMKHQIALHDLSGIKPAEWAEFYAEAVKGRAEKTKRPLARASAGADA